LSDSFGEAIPAGFFGGECGAAFAREAIELGFAASFGLLPVGGEEAAIFEAVERGIERAFGGLNYAARDLFEALGDGVAVNWTEGDDFENEEVEGALREVGFGWREHWFVRDTSGFYRLDERKITLDR
jgi:hypothetical protein